MLNFFFVLLLLSPSLLSMDRDLFNQQYLVHLSDILPEACTKMAGNRFRHVDSETFRSQPLPPAPIHENIRARMTLHHCLGGAVPDSHHGFSGSTLMGELKPTSYLHEKDPELCAFLDPVSAFAGELIGGIPEDIYSIDRHIYGQQSIAIVPIDRKQEFIDKNANFRGKLVIYNPESETVHSKLAMVIDTYAPGLPTYKDFDINLSYANYLAVKGAFDQLNLSCEVHEFSSFRLVEHLLMPFVAYVAKAHDCARLVAIDDDLHSYIALIDWQIKQILKEHTKRLSLESAQALRTWHRNTLLWLSAILHDPAREIVLKRLSTDLFELYKTNASSNLASYFTHIPWQKCLTLAAFLGEKGHAHGYAMLAERIFRDCFIEMKKNNGVIDSLLQEKVAEMLGIIEPSLVLSNHMRAVLNRLISLEDDSDYNVLTCHFLNNLLTQDGQQKIWGGFKHWTFKELLHNSPHYQAILCDEHARFNLRIIACCVSRYRPNYGHIHDKLRLELMNAHMFLLQGNWPGLLKTGAFENIFDLVTCVQPKAKDLSPAEWQYLRHASGKGLASHNVLALAVHINNYLEQRDKCFACLAEYYEISSEAYAELRRLDEMSEEALAKHLVDLGANIGPTIKKIRQASDYTLAIIDFPKVFELFPLLEPTIDYELVRRVIAKLATLASSLSHIKYRWLRELKNCSS